MSRSLRIASLLTLVVVALSLVACGGGDDQKAKNTYVQQVNAAQSEFSLTVQTVSRQITPRSTSSQDRRTLQRFERAIKDVVKTLASIKVPGSVVSEHQQLVRAMSGFGADIQKATSALRNPDTRAIVGAQQTIQKATQTVNARINAAIAAINSKLNAK